MLNHISIVGKIIDEPKIISSNSPALHFTIANSHYSNIFYFEVYTRRKIQHYHNCLKKGYKTAIEGRLVQTKSRSKILILALFIHILTDQSERNLQKKLIPDSFFKKLEQINMNKNQIILSDAQKKEVDKFKNRSAGW